MPDEFAPAVEDAVGTYEARFGERLRAIYLAGSLAFGEGLAGVSDMDMFGFVDFEPGPGEAQWRAENEAVLAGRYPEVSHFHLNINSCDHLARETWWRFIVRHNGVLLRGADIITEMEQNGVVTPAPSREVAKGRLDWVRKCFEGAAAGQAPKELFGRLPDNPYLATRKLARNFVILEGAYLLMAEGAFVSFRQRDVLCHLRRLYPQWEEVYAMAESTQRDPVAAAVTPERFMACLSPFMHWMIARIEAA